MSAVFLPLLLLARKAASPLPSKDRNQHAQFRCHSRERKGVFVALGQQRNALPSYGLGSSMFSPRHQHLMVMKTLVPVQCLPATAARRQGLQSRLEHALVA